jgi:fumarate reductase subunit D
MHTLIEPLFILVLGFLVYFGDQAISYAIARNTIRAICYGLVAVLSLLAVVVMLFHL